ASIPDLFRAWKALRRNIVADEDPLRQTIRRMDAATDRTAGMAIHAEGVEEAQVDTDTRSPVEAARSVIRRYRLQASRGPEGEAFRRAVRAAYRDTCLFSGLHLPRTELTASAGVDAAHILPW